MNKQLVYALEPTIFKKDALSTVEPLFNFVDSTSMLSWLDLRSMIFDCGLHFRLRVDYYQGVFVIVITAQLLFSVLNFYGWIDFLNLDLTADFWVSLICN